MTDEITFTLKENPADELYELLKDIDVEKTLAFTISDTHGKIAEYVKVIRCEDCIHNHGYICDRLYGFSDAFTLQDYDYCSRAEQKG